MIADLDKGDTITGSISIYEGGVRVRYEDGSLETIHSNKLYLDDPDGGMEVFAKKKVEHTFRPREEQKENVAYKEIRKEEKKAESKEESDEE